jgi:hypothetical protein
MTTLVQVDMTSIFETVTDRGALEVVQRVIQAEAIFHESRLAQLRDLDQAIGKRLQNMSRG